MSCGCDSRCCKLISIAFAQGSHALGARQRCAFRRRWSKAAHTFSREGLRGLDAASLSWCIQRGGMAGRFPSASLSSRVRTTSRRASVLGRTKRIAGAEIFVRKWHVPSGVQFGASPTGAWLGCVRVTGSSTSRWGVPAQIFLTFFAYICFE